MGFLEDITEAMLEAIEDPGRASASEVFVVQRPVEWTDADWDAFIAEVALRRGQLGHPDFGEIEI